MKRTFQNCKLVRIALSVCFLLFLSQSGICQTSTIRSDTVRTFDANDHIQEITRDLKLCDLVKAERDLLSEYNVALKNQIWLESQQRMKAESGQQEYKVKAKRRLKIILIAGCVILIKTTIQIALK